MALAAYRKKRNFKETPEPTGGKPEKEKLRFVIQKHAASHLHYDFRLEMEGVLKSWAVPKGPSTDPDVKRLAMMVEDHPYDYKDFEGIIPSGYGAGTVIVWDEGFYEPAEGKDGDKRSLTKNLLHQLYSGKIKITLRGKKLKGDFALVKAKGRGENAWLLFKLEDRYASKDDISMKDKSVISKKTLEQISKTSNNVYKSKSKAASSPKSEKTVPNNTKTKKADAKPKLKLGKREDAVSKLLGGAPSSKFPAALKPMLATLVDKPFDEEGWMFEVKWDGYRAMAFMNKGDISLRSRNDKSFDEKFYPIVAALKKWNLNAIVDGEVVVVNDDGISNFGALQNWRSEEDGHLYFYVFDILWLEGKDLTGLPLSDRRVILEANIPAEGLIRLSTVFEESGLDFFEAAKNLGLEGIMAKRSSSTYTSGNRSKDWLKIKANKRQEMVIGGFTKNNDSSKLFSALLVGVYENGRLRYTGKVGTGFNDKMQKEMLALFKKYIAKKPPFEEIPDINKPSRFRPNPPQATATWLRPELVCEVSFTEMTTDGIMRHPSFEGMRTDKNAKQVIEEKPQKTSVAKKKTSTAIVKPADEKKRRTFLNPTDETQVRKVNGHELKFSNLSKIYWPKEKITKRDLLNYYYQIAPYILPYLKNRPQSMLRHPDGIEGEAFFYKDVTGKAPSWVETYQYESDSDGRVRNYLVAKDEASLLYMASLGAIEMNPWHSTVKKEDYPDWCIIDLDPGSTTFAQVIEAALVTKQLLDEINVDAYPKTSGSKGIHIYIPLGAKYTYEQSREFARAIATIVNERIPSFTSIKRAVKDRKGKMYIDFLQNRPQATVSAPYSVRPKPGATVSMPLQWDEVKKGLKMSDFNIFNAPQRVEEFGDLFKPVLGKGINMNRAIKDLEKILGE